VQEAALALASEQPW